MNNFKIIYKILCYLEASMDAEEVDLAAISHTALGISRERWEQLLILMVESGYIVGVTVQQTLGDYRPHIITDIRPRITLKGLEYLAENSMMRKSC